MNKLYRCMFFLFTSFFIAAKCINKLVHLFWIVKIIPNFSLKKRPSFRNEQDFGAKMAKNRCFWKSLIVSGFRFIDIFPIGESYALGLSELCFEALICGKWAPQKPQMSVSKTTNDNVKEG